MNSMTTALKKRASKMVMLYVFVAMLLLMALTVPNFLTVNNLLNVFISFAIYGVTTIAMTFAIICGEFDLSVGSIMAISSLLFANFVNNGQLLLGLLLSLLAGLAFGALNGLLVSKFKIASFVVTLGTQISIKGLALMYSGGYTIGIHSDLTYHVGNGALWGVPYLVIIFFVILIASWFVLKYTTFGRNLYAVGGNYNMASYAGINASWYKFIIFVLLGLFASVSGIMMACRVSAGNSLYGSDLTMSAVAAVVVGGTNLNGGSGGVWRTLLGLLIMNFLFNALTLLGIDAYLQQFIKGFIVVAVVAIDGLFQLRSER